MTEREVVKLAASNEVANALKRLVAGKSKPSDAGLLSWGVRLADGTSITVKLVA